jgi:hypothetical protein
MRRKKSSMDEHGIYIYTSPGGDIAGKAGEWHGWGQ